VVPFIIEAVPFFATHDEMMNDINFRAMCWDWIDVGKCANMHVERLLARYKRSIFHQGPHAERVSAAGILSEWGHEHKEAGGRNPKITVAKHLVEDFNAPLNLARGRAPAMPNMARGSFLYASLCWQEHKRQNSTTRFTQTDYYDYRKKCCEAFTTVLSAAEQHDYNIRATTPGHGLNPLDSVIDKPAPRAYNLDGKTLWGLSTERSPLSEDCANELLQELLGVSEVGGFESYEKLIRKLFVDKLFVRDRGAIPSAWKNTSATEQQCEQKHPGLCSTQDADIYNHVLATTKELRKFVNPAGGDAWREFDSNH
jgi:hypothetical protein